LLYQLSYLGGELNSVGFARELEVTNAIWNAWMTSGLPNYEAPDREAQPVRAQDREVEFSSGLK